MEKETAVMGNMTQISNCSNHTQKYYETNGNKTETSMDFIATRFGK